MSRIQTITLLLVTQYSVARIMFHVGTMLVDREWSFHVAGILREFN